MPTKKGSWRDEKKGDCWARTGKGGGSYVVCEGSKGQKGVYEKKESTKSGEYKKKSAKTKKEAIGRLTNRPDLIKGKKTLTDRQKKIAHRKKTSQKEIKDMFGGYTLQELRGTAKAMGLGDGVVYGKSRTNVIRAIFKGGGNLRKKER